MAEHPLDTLKIRMQSQDSQISRMKSPVLILKHIITEEGAKALFQGLIPRLATYGIVKLSLFTLYEKFLSVTSNPALAGSCAGACNTLLSCPPDVIKCRLQMQDRRKLDHNGGFSANAINQARQLASKRGLPGLYLGWTALLVTHPSPASRDRTQTATLLPRLDAAGTPAAGRRETRAATRPSSPSTTTAGAQAPRPCGCAAASPA
jgi:hypothetical protein